MANITIPSADAKFGEGTCPHCGAKVTVKIDALWYRFFAKLQTLVNEQLTGV
jgi:hypothetical protein